LSISGGVGLISSVSDILLLLQPELFAAKLVGRIGAKFVASILFNYWSYFTDAIKKADLTGRLIGISLALGYPFSTQTISLLGFSLGTQVIKTCLETLYELGAFDIINNVTLLAGASHYENVHEQEKWEKIFNLVVGGEIKNVYSEGDLVLKLY
jgi:ABC-type Mn2+/Zn2+ transport system permease subunit